MHAALAIVGRTVLFCSVLIGSAVITLPGSKISLASVPSSTVSLKVERPQVSQPYLVGLRQFTHGSMPASKVDTPRTYFGFLNSHSFANELHSGTLTYGSESITLPFDETTGSYAFGPMRLKHPLVKTIVDAAYFAGVDPRLLMAIADKESSFIVSARAPTSSATGLFQFIESTWLRAIRDFGPRFGLGREAALLQGLESSASNVDAEDRAGNSGIAQQSIFIDAHGRSNVASGAGETRRTPGAPDLQRGSLSRAFPRPRWRGKVFDCSG